MPNIISPGALAARKHWIAEIKKLSGDFGADSTRLLDELKTELNLSGGEGLRSHLRLCGAIPEEYPHDSSEEKLYSKYTDVLASLAFASLGIRSVVLVERGDAADVECFSDDYEFVADAKAFRLSRTAKNAKDFKVPSMEKWKYHREHAMVICPSIRCRPRQAKSTAKPSITTCASFRSRIFRSCQHMRKLHLLKMREQY